MRGLKMAGFAALLALAAGVQASPASAQGFGIQIGPDRPRVERRYEEDYPRRGVVEERIIRRPAARRTVCRTEIRERIRRDGTYVRRPVQVCRTVVGGGYRRY